MNIYDPLESIVHSYVSLLEGNVNHGLINPKRLFNGGTTFLY